MPSIGRDPNAVRAALLGQSPLMAGAGIAGGALGGVGPQAWTSGLNGVAGYAADPRHPGWIRMMASLLANPIETLTGGVGIALHLLRQMQQGQEPSGITVGGGA